jgi:DNA-binding LytR/AlgR family response regulator
MLKIAICDDEVKELNRTNEMCNSYKALHLEYDIKISSFTCPNQLKLHIIQQERFDILLLDIYMPDMTGMELARFLRECNAECQIIFLTTSLAHAVEAFSLHAAHYLVKPFTVDQFEDAINKAISAVEKSKKTLMTLKTLEGIKKIKLEDLLFAETDRHIQHIHLADEKSQSVQVRITATALFELLSIDSRFFKCGSTYIVNLEKVEEVTTRYIKFDNGKQIPMQRRQYKELLDRYTRHALGGI